MSTKMTNSHLSSAMAAMLEDRETGDYTLVCGDKVLKVHFFIIAARSPYFKTKVNTPLNEGHGDKKMDLTLDCSPEVLEEAINFMYGKNIKKKFDDFAGLLDAAERFMMDDFKSEIGKRMVSEVKLNEDNYVEICGLANKYKVEVVADFCAEYIQAASVEPDWETLTKLPVIMTSSMMLLRANFDRMKGFRGCRNEHEHRCYCDGRDGHTCTSNDIMCSVHRRNLCTDISNLCTYTACNCCDYAKVINQNMGK